MKKLKFVLILIILVALPLLASESGHTGHEHFDWIAFWGKTFNFLVLVGALFYFLKKPIVNALENRSKEIKEDIVSREKNIANLKKEMAEIKKSLADFEVEREKIRKEAEDIGKEEKEKLLAVAKQEVLRIESMAKEEIEAYIANEVKNLKLKIGDSMISDFKNKAKIFLNDELQKKIIDRNIELCGEVIERS